jgi:hypothetical protein
MCLLTLFNAIEGKCSPLKRGMREKTTRISLAWGRFFAMTPRFTNRGDT